MKGALQVTVEAHQFRSRDVIGGDAALDFINTVTGRDQTPRDWLDSYARLLDWATCVDLAPKRVVRLLNWKAQNEPAAAARALARAKVLREALFDLVTAIIAKRVPSRKALALLCEHWVSGIRAHELRFSNGHVIAELRKDTVDLDLIASIVACRMVQRVLPRPLDRLRMCRGQNCSWVFLDNSKGGHRRWCDMAVCGNVAKTRRFRLRSRQRGTRRRGQ